MPRDHLGAAADDHLMHIAANQNLAMAEPCRDGVIGSPVADQRQRTDPPRALITGVVGGCRKALKDRSIALQAFADRLAMATQLFRPSLAAARFKMRVQVVEVPEPWHRHQEVPAAIADDALNLALVVTLARATKPILEQIVGS